MSKIIVECYREGRGSAMTQKTRRSRLKRAGDEGLRKESMRRPYILDGATKEPGERLNPLRRYLISQVGRPWDLVRSEMSEHMNRNSTMQNHIWQHAVDYVEINTFLEKDGSVWFNDNKAFYGSKVGAVKPITHAYAIVYVHPKSGCLVAVPHKNRWRKTKEKPQFVVVDKTHEIHKINGLWFVLTILPLPKEVFHEFRPDSLLFDPTGRVKGKWVYPDFKKAENSELLKNRKQTHYISEKKQCSSKELKRYKLQNNKLGEEWELGDKGKGWQRKFTKE